MSDRRDGDAERIPQSQTVTAPSDFSVRTHSAAVFGLSASLHTISFRGRPFTSPSALTLSTPAVAPATTSTWFAFAVLAPVITPTLIGEPEVADEPEEDVLDELVLLDELDELDPHAATNSPRTSTATRRVGIRGKGVCISPLILKSKSGPLARRSRLKDYITAYCGMAFLVFIVLTIR